MSDTRHDPTYLALGRSRQATCSCGWTASTLGTQAWAQIQFVMHITEATREANDLRAIYHHDWQTAAKAINDTHWPHAPEQAHAAGITLGKAGIQPGHLCTALAATSQIITMIDTWHDPASIQRAAEFVAQVHAYGVPIPLAPSIFAAADRVEYGGDCE